jgi:type IV pilus assembly protein PilN
MRLDINLATRPYEDAREFWVRWGLGVVVLGVLTLLLIGWTVSDWRKAGKDRQDIAYLQREIAERDKEREKAQAYLDLTANRSTRDQSQFVNSLIQRKSFSWTRVFEDLEQVMPSPLHVVSLRPELNDQNQVELEMRVAGDTRSAAIELVHRMEGSKHFQGTQLETETQAGENGRNIVIATVVTIYVPDEVPDVSPTASNRSDK